MSKNCHWALAAINYKNNDRVVACARNHGKLYSLSDSKLPSVIINSQGFKELRLNLSKDHYSFNCKTCDDWEKKGIVTYREKQNKEFWHDSLLKNFNPDTGEISFLNLEYLEFRFSNACNFSCLHCMPEYSSSWTNIVSKVNVTEEDKINGVIPLVNQVGNQSWTVDEAKEIAHDLIKNFPNVKHLDFAGGEPLYQKQFWAFLKEIIYHPNIKNININITSNFNTPVNYVELGLLLKNFNKSNIRISVDGSKNIYRYFRTGDWDKLHKNIVEFKSVNNVTQLEATNTISAYQTLDIFNNVKDMLTLPVDKYHYSFVQYPEYLDPSVVKFYFFEHIIKEIKEAYKISNLEKNELRKKSMQRMISDWFNFIDKSKTDLNLYKKFLYYVKRMDEIKNQNFDDNFTIKKSMLEAMTTTFCIAPWVHVTENVGGRLKPCCRFDTAESQFPKNNYSSIVTYFNGEDLKKFRNSMINQESNSGCQKCYSEEKNEKSSLRLSLNSLYPDIEKHVKSPKIKYLEIGLSNSCNLACVTCSSNYSTSWYQDNIKLNENGFKRERTTEKFIVSPDDYKNLDLSELDKLKILGGEPFMEPRNLDLLEQLKTLNRLEDLTLTIVTNSSIKPSDKWLEYLKKIKNIDLQISIDGVKDNSEFVRYGSSWDKINDTVTWWMNSKSYFKNITIKFHYVLHSLNSLDINNTLIWAKSLGINSNDFNFDVLTNPSYLSVKYLPNELKEEIYKNITLLNNHRALHFIKDSISTDSFSKEECTKLVDYVDNLIKIRNIKLDTSHTMLIDKLRKLI